MSLLGPCDFEAGVNNTADRVQILNRQNTKPTDKGNVKGLYLK